MKSVRIFKLIAAMVVLIPSAVTSQPMIDDFLRTDEGPVILPQYEPGHYYVIKRSPSGGLETEPSSWESYHLTTSQSEYHRLFPDTFRTETGFYVVGEHSVANPSDSDSDGLDDLSEIDNGTNPFLDDTDGDGFPDAQDPMPNTPHCDNRIITITIKTFIPDSFVEPGAMTGQFFEGDIIGGDDRSFDKESQNFRTSHVILASPYEEDSSSGLLSSSSDTGRLRSYDRETSVVGSSLYPEALDDEVEGVPFMVRQAKASSAGITVESRRISPTKIELNCKGEAENPLVLPEFLDVVSPDISYDFTITLEASNSGFVWWTISGYHGGFPSHEIYINERPIILHTAVGAPFKLLGGPEEVFDVSVKEGFARTQPTRTEGDEFLISGSAGIQELEWNGATDPNRMIQSLFFNREVASEDWGFNQMARIASLRYNIGEPPAADASGFWLDGELQQNLNFANGRLEYSVPKHEFSHHMRCGVNIHDWDTRATFDVWVKGEPGTPFSITGRANGTEGLTGGDDSFGYRIIADNGSIRFKDVELSNASDSIAYLGTSIDEVIDYEGVTFSKVATISLDGDHNVRYSHIIRCPFVPWHTSVASVELDWQFRRCTEEE